MVAADGGKDRSPVGAQAIAARGSRIGSQRAAESDHRNPPAPTGPAARRLSRRAGSVATRMMAEAIDTTSTGSKNSAASPQTSGMDAASDAMTGQPQCMASRGGMPKPSYVDGNTRATAF